MFQQARLKLTAWYLLIIMLVSIAFSLAIYRVLSSEIDRFARNQRFRIERRFANQPLPPFDTDLVDELKDRLVFLLLGINGTIFLASGGLGYLLAGRTLKPIREMLDEQNQFISDASHELRTPLTSLRTTMEVSLRDNALTVDEARNIIAGNIEDVNKLQLLSDSLLRLAQYQKPQLSLTIEETALRPIVTEAVRRTGPMAEQKSIRVSFDIPDIKLWCSYEEITSLLVIILDNAIKYSPKDTGIKITAGSEDNNVCISVADQGRGIEKKDLLRIFDRFYRADSARSKSGVGGYGLGLSIAKKIIDFHHGSISVKSRPGHGSTFVIHLPMKPAIKSQRLPVKI